MCIQFLTAPLRLLTAYVSTFALASEILHMNRLDITLYHMITTGIKACTQATVSLSTPFTVYIYKILTRSKLQSLVVLAVEHPLQTR